MFIVEQSQSCTLWCVHSLFSYHENTLKLTVITNRLRHTTVISFGSAINTDFEIQTQADILYKCVVLLKFDQLLQKINVTYNKRV